MNDLLALSRIGGESLAQVVIAICAVVVSLMLVAAYAMHIHGRLARAVTPPSIERLNALVLELMQKQETNYRDLAERMDRGESGARKDMDLIHQRLEYLEQRERDRPA